uniref:Uncharacterized protein n=1 Tax=Oncorhynchus tshawytscha TaxID=74940 RepID=A0AAZ3S5E7_ONCTS
NGCDFLTGIRSAHPGKSHSQAKNNPVLRYVKTLEDPWSIMLVASERAQLMANLAKLINTSKTIEIGMYQTLNIALVVPASGHALWSGKVDDPAPDDLTSQAVDKLNKKLHNDQGIDLSSLWTMDSPWPSNANQIKSNVIGHIHMVSRCFMGV